MKLIIFFFHIECESPEYLLFLLTEFESSYVYINCLLLKKNCFKEGGSKGGCVLACVSVCVQQDCKASDFMKILILHPQ